MLHPSAVKSFLREEKDSHVWVKQLSDKELDAILEENDFRSISKEPLDRHQKACIVLGLAYPHFSFWVDMGGGKTRIVLELLSHFWRKGKIHKVLIVVPADQHIAGWEDEIEKWGCKIPYMGVGKSKVSEKWQAIAELGAGLIIITYPGFNWLFARKEKNKKGKNKMKADVKKVRTFAKSLDGLVLDESPHLGNHQNVGWKVAKVLSMNCFVRYNLAGVPLGRDPHMIWSQQYLVDRGESLGETLGLFRGAFFNAKPGWFGGFEYKFLKEMEPKLTKMMQHRSIAYTFEELSDLDDLVYVERKCRPSSETLSYFEDYLKQLRAARGDKAKIVNIFLRMRQLSSGFIGAKDDETGERVHIRMPDNPKLDYLVNDIEDMPDSCKFVIFHEFVYSGRLIMEALEKRGIKLGWFWSGTTNGRLLKKKFDNEDPRRMKGLLINNHVGTEGLNLQRANYTHMFERPIGVIGYKQAQRRTYRKGQTRRCFQFDYFATPVDRRIALFHEKGEDIFKALISDPFSTIQGRQDGRSAVSRPKAGGYGQPRLPGL